MKKNETWFEFMNRAKQNGISPTTQEEIDKKEKEKENEFNRSPKNSRKIR